MNENGARLVDVEIPLHRTVEDACVLYLQAALRLRLDDPWGAKAMMDWAEGILTEVDATLTQWMYEQGNQFAREFEKNMALTDE